MHKISYFDSKFYGTTSSGYFALYQTFVTYFSSEMLVMGDIMS